MSNLEEKIIHANIMAKFFSGLSNPVRYRIVATLANKDMTVNELVNELGYSQSQISNHLACLKWCGYVSSLQEGRYVRYRVTDKRLTTILKLAQEVVVENSEHISSCTRM